MKATALRQIEKSLAGAHTKISRGKKLYENDKKLSLLDAVQDLTAKVADLKIREIIMLSS